MLWEQAGSKGMEQELGEGEGCVVPGVPIGR